MGKLTVEQKLREHGRGQKAASEGRPRSWSEPWAYPFESDEHYEERREAFNQGYGIIDPTPMSIWGISSAMTVKPASLQAAERGGWREQLD
jgi:hypothetical protein